MSISRKKTRLHFLRIEYVKLKKKLSCLKSFKTKMQEEIAKEFNANTTDYYQSYCTSQIRDKNYEALGKGSCCNLSSID